MGGSGIGYLGDLANVLDDLANVYGSPPWDMQSAAQEQSAAAHQNMMGCNRSWEFVAPELTPFWLVTVPYDPGRDSAWIKPLADPGATLLKIAGYLAIYPAVYLTVLAIKGLFNALF